MRPGDLVRTTRVRPQYFGGDLFSTWENFEGELPSLIGIFPINALGIVLEIADGREPNQKNRYYLATGAKVIVNGLVGWIHESDVEVVSPLE